MASPPVTLADWRAQVEKELQGVPFDKALVHTTAEGIAIQPLYTEPLALSVPVPATGAARLCMPCDGDEAGLAEDLAGGAEALWLRGALDVAPVLARAEGRFLVIDSAAALDEMPAGARFALAGDTAAALRVARDFPGAHGILVSTLAWHLAGADAADELAAALSTGAAALGDLLDAGLAAAAAAAQIAVQVAVGRDTFGELCKLRALRLCWSKLCIAYGAPASGPALLHAVASLRTATIRDPGVNMLRGTTEMFAAILGGADLATPLAFDAAAGPPSPLGRRVARNTVLVLREESQLGRVVDPAAGSYFLETFTDALAREAWRRFRAIEAEGGIAALVADGRWRARLEATWARRRDAVARRKEPIVGVSDFVNLDDGPPKRRAAPAGHRDAEELEALRDRADALAAPRVALVNVGPAAEHRTRAAWATAFFAVGGLRVSGEPAAVACLCGSDERYPTEAAAAARALKAGGARRVLLAGRPGALEADLRAAGVDDFIFVGCDVAATLRDVLEVLS